MEKARIWWTASRDRKRLGSFGPHVPSYLQKAIAQLARTPRVRGSVIVDPEEFQMCAPNEHAWNPAYAACRLIGSEHMHGIVIRAADTRFIPEGAGFITDFSYGLIGASA